MGVYGTSAGGIEPGLPKVPVPKTRALSGTRATPLPGGQTHGSLSLWLHMSPSGLPSQAGGDSALGVGQPHSL